MVTVRRPLITVLWLVMLAATLVAVTPPSPADAATPRPWPAVWDVVPATGEVLPVGPTSIQGTATAPSGIASVEVRVDGQVIPHVLADQNDIAARIHAAFEVTPGEHVASIRFVANDGTPTERVWRFAGSTVGLTRISGPDRYATAVQIASRDRERQEAPAAVLARGDDHADALAGVPLAFHLEAPLLLTEQDRLTPITANALRDLVRPGGTVHLLGGTVAISSDVASRVRDLGFRVARHAGDDRYETAATIAKLLPASDSAVVASGTSFPDALAAAAPAAINGQPILLTGRDALPAATRQALQGLERVNVIGGQVVVSDAVVGQVDQAAGRVRRIAGADRYATARDVVAAYDLDTSVLGLASGETFPDALAGALDAARLGTGLLLTHDLRLPNVTRGAIRSIAPETIRVYGGDVAVDRGVAAEARNAVTDRGPVVTKENPAPTGEIHSLDQVTLTFSDPLSVAESSISVLFGGRELHTKFSTGDFDDTIVLTVLANPVEPALGEAIPVRVVGAVRDGEGWTHVDRTWIFRKVALSSGDAGNRVAAIQNRLVDLGYWLGTPDGEYGYLTVQAIMAFQKYEGLPITGTADFATQQRLATAARPVGVGGGRYDVEIDKSRQVLLIIDDTGRTIWAFNTSTGSEIPYDEEGGSGSAVTPVSDPDDPFRVTRQIDGLREGPLGDLWRPKYFVSSRGIAIHGSSSVPAYPASHGCVRVSNQAMNYIWEHGLIPLGSTVHVYGTIPG